MNQNKTSEALRRVCTVGILAALAFVGFTFLRIPLGTSYFHLGNVICILGALLFGGVTGGLGGAIGMTIGDLFSGYAYVVPKYFVIKLCIGLVTGLIAHKVLHINKETDRAKVYRAALLGSLGGAVFNAVFDPIVGYFYDLLFMHKDVAALKLSYEWVTTSVNAVIAVIVTMVLYMALRPALQKAGLLQAAPLADAASKK